MVANDNPSTNIDGTSLLCTLLVRSDRVAITHGVETTSPFLAPALLSVQPKAPFEKKALQERFCWNKALDRSGSARVHHSDQYRLHNYVNRALLKVDRI